MTVLTGLLTGKKAEKIDIFRLIFAVPVVAGQSYLDSPHSHLRFSVLT